MYWNIRRCWMVSVGSGPAGALGQAITSVMPMRGVWIMCC